MVQLLLFFNYFICISLGRVESLEGNRGRRVGKIKNGREKWNQVERKEKEVEKSKK